ncbi:MAG: alpha-2-macroglobulin, partial [Planctomycetes bacterium]|nr:alpha-2-macroglobulin [Planctomycetota bacterium]
MCLKLLFGIILFSAFPLLFPGALPLSGEEDIPQSRQKAEKEWKSGNYKDAYDIFSRLALDPGNDPKEVIRDFDRAVTCLQNLGRKEEIDAFRDKAVEVNRDNWRFLWIAADSILREEHAGNRVAGKFLRGTYQGGEYVTCMERDRTQALKLYERAMEKSQGAVDKESLPFFYLQFAQQMLWERRDGSAWKLQSLTDLDALPDYEEGYGHYGSENVGAPVDEEGNPLFYNVPESWEAAKNDGQRWRWLLSRGVELNPGEKQNVDCMLAHFLRAQFGVQTLLQYSGYLSRSSDPDRENGVYTLHTLGEDETLARLANGIKRFKLPEEFNFIKIYREVGHSHKSNLSEGCLENLAYIFENRRQYTKAAECWEECIEHYNTNKNQLKHRKERLNQIRGNFGEFEPVMSQPADQGAAVDYRFRNGSRVKFTAHEIHIPALLNDIKDYLKSNPSTVNNERVNIGHIGYEMVQDESGKYVGREVASWSLDLSPRKNHFDRRITVTTPLQKAGAYLLTAKMDEGNTSRIILWLSDTVIVEKPMDQGAFFQVADARTGEPLPKVNVEFFGYRMERVEGALRKVFRKFNVLISNFAEFTDPDGQVILREKDLESRYNWLITATT